MKIIVALFVFCMAITTIHSASTSKRKNLNKSKVYTKIQRECRQKTGVSQDAIVAARNGNFTEDKLLQEHLLCLSKRLGYQDDNGKLQESYMREKFEKMHVDPARLDELFKKCVAEKDTPEHTAWSIIKCLYENANISAFQATFFKDEDLDVVRKYNRECLVESKVDNKTLENAKQGNIEETEALGNHLFCLFQKINYQNELGEIQPNQLRKDFQEYIDEETLEEIVKKCAVNKDTPQLTAFNYQKCINENSPFEISVLKLF